jgi:TonB family protein
MLWALLLAAAVTAPAEPTALAPTGKWTVEYADTMCVLARDYGSGADKVTLALRPMPMGTETQVALFTQGRGALVPEGKAEITLMPDGQPTTGTYQRFAPPTQAVRVATMYFDGAALDGLDKTATIALRLGKETHFLAVPGIAGAMKALTVCQADLLKGWGIEMSERANLAKPASGNPARFFGPSAYPQDAVSARQQGRVVSVLSIGPTGKVEKCTIVATSKSPSLDAATCEILRGQGHFSPAIDLAGQPVAAHLIVPVRWVLPDS